MSRYLVLLPAACERFAARGELIEFRRLAE